MPQHPGKIGAALTSTARKKRTSKGKSKRKLKSRTTVPEMTTRKLQPGALV